MWTIREDGVVPGDDPLLLLLAVHDHDGILDGSFLPYVEAVWVCGVQVSGLVH